MNREDEICELALSILEQRYVMRPRKNEDDKYWRKEVRLLGGFIYIDPDYKNGRRVIFSIAI